MAEYNDVIKHFKRMCRYYNNMATQNDCPLYCNGHGCNISHCRLLAFDDKKFQNIVMTWAKENPEPQYATWGEWLLKIGAARRVPVGNPWPVEMADGSMLEPAYDIVVKEKARIPAYIAEKLGLQPKEG